VIWQLGDEAAWDETVRRRDSGAMRQWGNKAVRL
jgi:hypothetical protein